MLSRPLRRWLAVAALAAPGACSLNPQPDLPLGGGDASAHDPSTPTVGGTKATGPDSGAGAQNAGGSLPMSQGGTFASGGVAAGGTFSAGGTAPAKAGGAGGEESGQSPLGGDNAGGAEPEPDGGAGAGLGGAP